jgi:hypothetical protein
MYGTNGNWYELLDSNVIVDVVPVTGFPFMLIQNETSVEVPPCVFSTCAEKPNSYCPLLGTVN